MMPEDGLTSELTCFDSFLKYIYVELIVQGFLIL